MASQTFDFQGATGQMLSGKLELPQATARGWAIFAHCFTCGKDSLAAVRVSRALARAGIGVLRFDFAGLGGSDGEFGAGTFAADVDDLIAAATAMTEAGLAPTMLVGHSLGGAAVLAAAGSIPSTEAIATIAAPADLNAALNLFSADAVARIEQDGAADVDLGGRPFHIRRSLIDNLRDRDLTAQVHALRLPLLVMHAPGDRVVDVENATAIFHAAFHPKSFVSLDDADHLLTRSVDADYAADVIAAWASRYLALVEPDMFEASAGDGVNAVETLGGDFQLRMRSGEHFFLADEPKSVGGLGSGLSPFEFVSAGLAACTLMTVRMYARRKGFPLERASARVVHHKRTDALPADVFERVLTLEGALDAEQRAKILAIADRCPVDLTLVRGSEVTTTLVE
jgi:uncharacterized OsmC-like protein/alpha-beta hydrolase superfamily lysophospholipase